MQSGHYIVSGGSSGIGAAVVGKLVAEDQTVTSIARRNNAHGSPSVRSLQCDLSKTDAITDALKTLGNLELLEGVVLCHGHGDFGHLEQFSIKRIEDLISTNFTSYLVLLRFLLPILKKRGRGTIVIMGSEAALQGAKQGSVYCATKFALRGMAQALRHECSASGVRVCLINPGMVDTPFFDALSFGPGENDDNVLQASDIAETVMGVLRAPMNQVIDEINLSPLKHVVRHR